MFAIFGTGGFGRELLDLAQTVEGMIAPEIEGPVFVQDDPASDTCNGVPAISFTDLCSARHRHRRVIVAIGDGRVRRSVTERCEAEGLRIGSLQSPHALIQGAPAIGPGAVFCAFSMVTCDNVRIGKCFQANIYSYVAHDCVIGDYVTFAPSVHCNGNVHIGDGAYIGTGVIIKQGRPDKPLVIGENAVVGMGAVVTKDVPPSVTVIGNPATEMKRRPRS